MVWKLDRLGRSVREVLTIADDLHARGIGVQILTGKLSGSYSPHGEGKFFFTMMAAFAELERDIIHERTMAGLAAARAQGRYGGRPTVMDAGQARRRPGAPGARREPDADRQGPRRQPRLGLPPPRRWTPRTPRPALPSPADGGGPASPLVSPVIRKIFSIRSRVQARSSEPSCVRTRFRPASKVGFLDSIGLGVLG